MTKRASKNAKTSIYTPVRFLPINLESDDKLWLEAHDLGVEFPLSTILDLAEGGFKVSLSPDKENNRFICSLVDKGRDETTRNTCISGSGATALDAWYAVAYRHFIKLESDWATLAGDGDGDTTRFG